MFKYRAAAITVAMGIVLFGGLALAPSHRGVVRTTAGRNLLPASAGMDARFAFLARQTSNRCALQPQTLMKMSALRRLQGSCCDPMALSAYRWQVQALHTYRSIWQIPSDPYDVPVALAQRLLTYDRSVRLSSAQAGAYTAAMEMSRLKGPCCCRCWRWYAFRGLSKYLLTDRAWPPARLAALTSQIEGCGGLAERA